MTLEEQELAAFEQVKEVMREYLDGLLAAEEAVNKTVLVLCQLNRYFPNDVAD
jgi:hypothetical protein